MTAGHGHIERVVIRFPGLNTKRNLFACGVPGIGAEGGKLFIPADAGTFSALAPNAAEDSYVRIDLPKRGSGDGPVRGIGIAPDSAIHTCDIAIVGKDGDTQRHRISPGNPLLGTIYENDFAYVSLPNSIPGLTYNPVNNLSIFADASDVINVDGVQYVGWPLRLEVFRGDVLPVRSPYRAAYKAHCLAHLDLIAETDVRYLYFCVDGRRRIDVIAIGNSSQAVTITADSIEAKLGIATLLDLDLVTPLVLDDIGSTSLTFNSTPKIISFYGNPITILRVTVSVPATTSDVNVLVKAWDH